jgi:AcrR family transcriptional regulator
MSERSAEATVPMAPADMTPSQRARRDRVLASVLELVGEGRLEDLQMKDVAARSGVALGTIYRYFASKEHVLAAALSEWARQLDARTTQRSLPTGGPDDRLVAVLRRGVRAYEREPNIARLLLLIASSSDPHAHQCYRDLSDSVMGVMRRALVDLPDDRAHVVQRVVGAVWSMGLFDWVNGRRTIAQLHADLDHTVRILLA